MPPWRSHNELARIRNPRSLCVHSESTFILLTCNFALGPLKNLGVNVPEGWLNARKALGMTGFLLVLWAYNLSFQTHLREDQAFIGFITSRKFLLAALFLGGVHLFFMGYQGWLKPAGWHGGMPPVSLVAFLFFVVGYTINLVGRR